MAPRPAQAGPQPHHLPARPRARPPGTEVGGRHRPRPDRTRPHPGARTRLTRPAGSDGGQRRARGAGAPSRAHAADHRGHDSDLPGHRHPHRPASRPHPPGHDGHDANGRVGLARAPGRAARADQHSLRRSLRHLHGLPGLDDPDPRPDHRPGLGIGSDGIPAAARPGPSRARARERGGGRAGGRHLLRLARARRRRQRGHRVRCRVLRDRAARHRALAGLDQCR